ncbi:hypothetical protein AGMMS4956_20010 [Bacteroidia bacterium]|nr:hypothetical protein AGMMS4956_20010 [Bacteroidia bacterium]
MKRLGLLILLMQCAFWAAVANDTTSIEKEQQVTNKNNLAEVRLYPNPVVSELNIQCSAAPIMRVELWSLNKELVFVAPIEIPQGAQLTVNMAQYASSYYIVKVYLKNNVVKTVWIRKN